MLLARSLRPPGGSLSQNGAASPHFVDGDWLRERLPYDVVVDALAEAFLTTDFDAAPLRWQLPVGSGEMLLMPISSPLGVGVKLLTLCDPRRAGTLPMIQGVFVLFSSDTLSPVAVLDGGALTSVRTAAVSALATRRLARPDARRLVIFGAGVQGRAHLDAMCAVREVEHVSIVDRHEDRARALIEATRALGLSAAVGDDSAIQDADLICTCTTSSTPLFDGAHLRPGTHINAMGSYKLDRRELDGVTMQRARVVVEHRETALAEAGDLALAIAEKQLLEPDIGELAELLRPGAPARGADEITVFKSVGLAFEDLAVAQVALSQVQAAHAAPAG